MTGSRTKRAAIRSTRRLTLTAAAALLLSNAYWNLRWMRLQSTFFAPRHIGDSPSPLEGIANTSKERRRGGTTVPDWRHAVDCSTWDSMCAAHARLSRGRKYGPYPFPLIRHVKNLGELDHVPISGVPPEWLRSLDDGAKNWTENSLDDLPVRRVTYITPPEAPALDRERCVRDSMYLHWKDQIDRLLDSGRVRREPMTGMVAFTISDYNYARDMTHDVFEMNSDVVGFDGAFFMVALDGDTLELACRYGYAVVAWPSAYPGDIVRPGGTNKPLDVARLKRAVANTKFEVSLHLVARKVSFLFYEMDVWFLRSPRDLIAAYHRGEGHDILASSHMNDPMAINIGVYSVVANERTREYFQLCILMASESPGTHDQWIMSQLLLLAWTIREMGAPGVKFNRLWRPPPSSNPPNMTLPPRHGLYGAAEVVAGERPYPSGNTIAIHTLCEGPMKKPDGKKMMAKELGAWMGFTGRRSSGGGAAGSEVAGYYARSGTHRRYLWMDGHGSPGVYNTLQTFEWDVMESESFLVDHAGSLRWTMAVLLALSRRTGRIFVMPRIVATEGVHFLWTLMDFSPVEEMHIEYRETGFPHNRKSWASDDEPYRTVTRTALAPLRDVDGEGTMYVQHPAGDAAVEGGEMIRAWKFENNTSEVEALDAWWALHTVIPEVDSAELLLANPHFVSAHYARRSVVKMTNDNYAPSIAEKEIFGVYKRLRWCPGDPVVLKQNTVGRSSAEMSCYGRGIPWHVLPRR